MLVHIENALKYGVKVRDVTAMGPSIMDSKVKPRRSPFTAFSVPTSKIKYREWR